MRNGAAFAPDPKSPCRAFGERCVAPALSPIAVRRNRRRTAENRAEGIAGAMEGDTFALPNGAIYRKLLLRRF